MKITDEYVIHLKAALSSARRGEKETLMERAAADLGITVSSVYRRLQKLGPRVRRRRSDAGESSVPPDLARLAAGLVAGARRANGKKTLPLSTAREILAAGGYGAARPESGEIFMPSISALSRAMRRIGCHPEQLAAGSPALSLRSLHPNHAWQADASLCVLFYLPGGRVRIFDEREQYKNRLDRLVKSAPERVTRWLVTDHYSGAFFLRYTLGGEGAAGLADLLVECMCRRAGEDSPFGVPEYLLMDRGAANTSALIRNLLAGAGVKAVFHAPGNPRAKGQVEQAQNLVETQFEGRLRMLRVENLAQLNAAADQWRLMYCRTKIHSRHGRSRHAMWRTIGVDELRVPSSPEALRECANTSPQRRRAGRDLRFTFAVRDHGRLEYSLRGLEILPGGEYSVRANLYRAPCVDVVIDPDGAARRVVLEPVRKDGAGFAENAAPIGAGYAALPENAVEKNRKRILFEAYGARGLTEARERAKSGAAMYAGVDPLADVHAAKGADKRVWLPKSGREFTPAAPAPAPSLDHVAAAIVLSGRFSGAGLEWTARHMRELARLHPLRVPADALESLFNLLRLLDAPARTAAAERGMGGAS